MQPKKRSLISSKYIEILSYAAALVNGASRKGGRQSSVRVKGTGEGEIGHVYSKWGQGVRQAEDCVACGTRWDVFWVLSRAIRTPDCTPLRHRTKADTKNLAICCPDQKYRQGVVVDEKYDIRRLNWQRVIWGFFFLKFHQKHQKQMANVAALSEISVTNNKID